MESDELAENTPATLSISLSRLSPKLPPESGKHGRKAVPASPATTKKKGATEEEEDTGPILQVSNKARRTEKAKSPMLTDEEPKRESFDQLRKQMEVANFSRTLLANMFQEDFKFHIKALDSLQRALEDCPDATVSNLDLILRWLALRFLKKNPSPPCPTYVKKAISYMSDLFNMLDTLKNYQLADYEAKVLVPVLIAKICGDRQDSIRKGFRQVIKQIQQIYSPVKVFDFLVQGLASNNSVQRAECLEELGEMISTLGLDPFSPASNLKTIAKQIGDVDSIARDAALNAVTIAYHIIGDKVFAYIGKMNPKEQSMLDERIKRSAKMPPPPPPAALKPQQQATPARPPQREQASNGMHRPSSTNVISHQQPSILPLTAQTLSPESVTTSNPSPNRFVTFSSIVALAASSETKPPRRAFGLDLDLDLEDLSGMPNVKLTDYSDIEEIMRKPVELPPPERSLSANPLRVLRDSAADVREAIDSITARISRHNIGINIPSLIQVITSAFKMEVLPQFIESLFDLKGFK